MTIRHLATDGQMPSPPWPPPDSLIFAATVRECLEESVAMARESGWSLTKMITHAVATGWMEGYCHAHPEARPGGPLDAEAIRLLEGYVGPEVLASLARHREITDDELPPT